jgi:hypothetical protein
MSQLTIYMPAEMVRELKSKARRANSSVSAYLTTLVRRETSTPTWSKTFRSALGSWRGEGIDEPEELPLERRARLK